jgi:DNA-binding NarL/FixJ family response regulator
MPAEPRRAARPSPARPRSQTPEPGGAGVRVLCVDDHPVLVEGLKAQFSIDGRISVIGRLASAEGLLNEVSRLKPDVVLLDIEMPGPDVFEAADRLRHAHPKLRFVFLSAHVREGYLAAAYKCGSWGYFAKADELDDIATGIIEVAHSPQPTFVMGPKVRQRCAPTPHAPRPPQSGGQAEPSPPKTPLQSLSTREIEVLRMIGRGLSRKQIASELSRSAKTIDGHQYRIMKKLKISTRAELVRLAIREGFAEP